MNEEAFQLVESLKAGGTKRRRKPIALSIADREALASLLPDIPSRLRKGTSLFIARREFEEYETDENPDQGDDEKPKAKNIKSKKPRRFPVNLVYDENDHPLTAIQVYRKHIIGWESGGSPKFSTQLSWADRDKAQDNFYCYRENYWNRFGRRHTLGLLADICFADNAAEITSARCDLTNKELKAALKEDKKHHGDYHIAMMQAIGHSPDKLALLDETLKSSGYYKRWMEEIQLANEAEGKHLPVHANLVVPIMRKQLPQDLGRYPDHYLMYYDSTLLGWIKACAQPERPHVVRAEGISLLAHILTLHPRTIGHLSTSEMLQIIDAAPKRAQKPAHELKKRVLEKEQGSLQFQERSVQEAEESILAAQKKLEEARTGLSRQKALVHCLRND